MTRVIKQTKKRESLCNEFLREMKRRNFKAERIGHNMYKIDSGALKAMFHFGPFGRVGVQPLPRVIISQKRMFWKAEVVADDFGHLMKKCLTLKVVHERDYNRYFD